MSKHFSKPVSAGIATILLLMLAAGLICAWQVRHAQLSNSAGSTRILKLGHGLSQEHPVHKAMERMADRIKELSGGTLAIEIYPSGMIGSETECYKQVQNGQLDMSKTSAATLETSMPVLEAFSAPYVFRDAEHFWKVLDGPIGQGLAARFPGLHGVCYFDAGTRSFYTSKKPIKSVDDLKGMKIRTQESRCAMAMVRAFDASPTPIPWGELYSALSQNTVDAAENNLPSYDSGRHTEVCKYFTFSEHTRIPDVLVIGKTSWDSLSEEQQKWLMSAAAEASLYQRQLWAEAEKVSMENAKKQGVEFFYIEDRAPFVAKMQKVYDELPPDTLKLVKEIQEVK